MRAGVGAGVQMCGFVVGGLHKRSNKRKLTGTYAGGGHPGLEPGPPLAAVPERKQPMDEVTYLFIDGAYLRRRYEDDIKEFFSVDAVADDLRLSEIADYCKARKTFYYDCFDDRKLTTESEDEFKERQRIQKKQLDDIAFTSGFHVRLGYLAGKERRQKEVDVLLAVDMMNHAIRKNMTRAVLLAGDRDFKPVVESLVQLGVWVEVLASARSLTSGLKHAADSWRRLSLYKLWQWSSASFRKLHPNCPADHSNDLPERFYLDLGSEMNTFTCKRGTVLLYGRDGRDGRDGTFTIMAPQPNPERLAIRSTDLDMLRQYFDYEYGDYGKIDWEAETPSNDDLPN